MKKFQWVLLLLSVFSLSSCFDIIEEFTLKDDGSGVYSVKMDMYPMIEMMSKMGGEDGLKNNKDYDVVVDSSFSFREYIDSAEGITPEQRELFRNGRFNMYMHLKEKKSYATFSFPYGRREELPLLYNSSPVVMGEVGKRARQDSVPEGNNGRVMPSEGAGNDMAKANQYFDLVNTAGVFEKKVRKDDLKAYLEKDSLMKQMMPLMGEAHMITIVHLPRPAKRVYGEYAELSKDRRTVTFTYPFAVYMEKPEDMNMKVEY